MPCALYKSTTKRYSSELRSCVKVEVAVPGSPSLASLLVFVDVKHQERRRKGYAPGFVDELTSVYNVPESLAAGVCGSPNQCLEFVCCFCIMFKHFRNSHIFFFYFLSKLSGRLESKTTTTKTNKQTNKQTSKQTNTTTTNKTKNEETKAVQQ